MEDLPGEVALDAQVIVAHLRSIAASLPGAYPRSWTPRATFNELEIRANREPIHLHPSLHHLHRHWDMGNARTHAGSGHGPKAIGRRILARIVGAALDRYFVEEQEFRAALAQSIDAVAYRVDEVSGADFHALFEMVRGDLLDLARFVEERLNTLSPEVASLDRPASDPPVDEP